MKKMTDAYMTVEATLLVPFVIIVSLFLIYVGFYQYDRCLMRQDAYRAALQGSSIYRTDNQAVYNAAVDAIKRYSEDKYIGTECEIKVVVQREVSVAMSGAVAMPFRGLATISGQSEWVIRESMSSKCINPVFFIRACRRVLPQKSDK